MPAISFFRQAAKCSVTIKKGALAQPRKPEEKVQPVSMKASLPSKQPLTGQKLRAGSGRDARQHLYRKAGGCLLARQKVALSIIPTNFFKSFFEMGISTQFL